MSEKLVLKSFAGECSAPEKWEMRIHFISGGDKVKIDTSKGSDVDAKGYFVQLFDGLKEDSEGNITIPADGNTYWFVPIGSNVPYRLIAGSSVTTDCYCGDFGAGGTCDKLNNSGTISCTEKNCTKCCVLVVTDGPFGVWSLRTGGIMLKANEIDLNGVKFTSDERNFSFSSLYGECSKAADRHMQVQFRKEVAYVNIVANSPKIKTNTISLFTIDLPIQKDGRIIFPDDGSIFWYIPFDENTSPQRMIAGGGMSGGLSCSCDKTGDCKVETISNTNGTFSSFCQADTCTGCCNGTYKDSTARSLPAGGLIVKAKEVNINGKSYK